MAYVLISKAKDSSTYQLILSEGEAEGRIQVAQNILLIAGEGHLGKPNANITRQIRTINSIEILHARAKRLFAVESWTELLATPQ